jgi:hypothetical protein
MENFKNIIKYKERYGKSRKKKKNNENFGKIIEISGNLICF